jgi:NAD-dependent deacetylase
MGADGLLCRAADWILRARHLVALTGAGVSTPSGIPDFRSPDSGLWNRVNPFLAASIVAFRIRPQLFFDWIRPLANMMLDAAPNAAHLALAQLEQMGRLQTLITQNIDNLHQKAGSTRVIELHGTMRHATCVRCHHVMPTAPLLPRFLATGELPRCDTCGGVMKPDVILFGEQLPVQEVDAARAAAGVCDVMLVLGSSLTVAPAADLPAIACDNGARVIVINRQDTWIDDRAALVIHDDVAKTLPDIVARVACGTQAPK